MPLLEGERARAGRRRGRAAALDAARPPHAAAGRARLRARYEGGVRSSATARYHQGTVWPWLLGPFVEAWVRVRGDSADARREARRRFFEPLLAHLDAAGLGHVSEIADAEPPHTPRGCPFQAWSVGEALRLDSAVLRRPGRSPGEAAEPAPPGR